MEKTFTQGQFWDKASRAGLMLSIPPIVYFVYGQSVQLHSSSAFLAIVISIVNFAIWFIKLSVCLNFMKRYMMEYSEADKEATHWNVFLFGAAAALLSALIYSGVSLAWTSLIAPDTYANAIEMVKETQQFTEEMLSELDSINFNQLSFYANLIYCTLFGTVVSAIYSRNIPSEDIF